MYKYIILLTYVVYIQQSIAQDVVFIEKDAQAPYAGFLFTPEKEKETRLKLVDLNFYMDLDSSKTRQIELYKQEGDLLRAQVDLHRDNSVRLNNELMSANNDGFWKGFWMFALGAGVTTAITYAVRR